MNETPPELPNLQFLRKVGEGGMSSVWKAFDLVRNEIVAVKILNHDLTENPEDIELFRTEAEALSAMNHQSIVKSYDLSCHEGVWYYTMEFVDGYTFGTLLARKQHLGESDCLLICESVAVALDFAWNEYGLVHCDIKPENIMINSDGIVKLMDLGLCHTFTYMHEGRQDVPDHVMGTPAYISPEQVYGDLEPDCRTDIYSLAASLYHLATGRMLFPGLSSEDMMRAHCCDTSQARDPRYYRPILSEGFCQLLEAMLVKDRDYRIPSWKDVCSMCLSIEQGLAFKPRSTVNPSSLLLAKSADGEDDGNDTTARIDFAETRRMDNPSRSAVPEPKRRMMTFRKDRKQGPTIQTDPNSGKRILTKHKPANPKFRINKPADWYD